MAMVAPLPDKIYIGTTRRFHKGQTFVYQYELMPVGPVEKNFVCMTPPDDKKLPDDVTFICQESGENGQNWWVVYVGRVIDGQLEQRAPLFRTQADFWLVGSHEWETNEGTWRQTYDSDWEEPVWRSSGWTVETRLQC